MILHIREINGSWRRKQSPWKTVCVQHSESWNEKYSFRAWHGVGVRTDNRSDLYRFHA